MKKIKSEQVIKVLQKIHGSSKIILRMFEKELYQLPIEITFQGRPIRNDLERARAISTIMLAVGTAPALISLHFLLHQIGRKGFWNNRKIKVDFNGFKNRN